MRLIIQLKFGYRLSQPWNVLKKCLSFFLFKLGEITGEGKNNQIVSKSLNFLCATIPRIDVHLRPGVGELHRGELRNAFRSGNFMRVVRGVTMQRRVDARFG
jgi:hypothetical protein